MRIPLIFIEHVRLNTQTIQTHVTTLISFHFHYSERQLLLLFNKTWSSGFTENTTPLEDYNDDLFSSCQSMIWLLNEPDSANTYTTHVSDKADQVSKSYLFKSVRFRNVSFCKLCQRKTVTLYLSSFQDDAHKQKQKTMN